MKLNNRNTILEVIILGKKNKISRENDALDAFDLVNKYGTYEVQDTDDTSNLFPMIAQGLPIKELQNKGFKSKTQSNKDNKD